jgi:D-galactarolactone isomerase
VLAAWATEHGRHVELPAGEALVLDHCGQIAPGSAEELAGLTRLLDCGQVWVKLAPTQVGRQPGRQGDPAAPLRITLNAASGAVAGRA